MHSGGGKTLRLWSDIERERDFRALSLRTPLMQLCKIFACQCLLRLVRGNPEDRVWTIVGMMRHLSKSPERVDLCRLLIRKGSTRPAFAMAASLRRQSPASAHQTCIRNMKNAIEGSTSICAFFSKRNSRPTLHKSGRTGCHHAHYLWLRRLTAGLDFWVAAFETASCGEDAMGMSTAVSWPGSTSLRRRHGLGACLWLRLRRRADGFDAFDAFGLVLTSECSMHCGIPSVCSFPQIPGCCLCRRNSREGLIYDPSFFGCAKFVK